MQFLVKLQYWIKTVSYALKTEKLLVTNKLTSKSKQKHCTHDYFNPQQFSVTTQRT